MPSSVLLSHPTLRGVFMAGCMLAGLVQPSMAQNSQDPELDAPRWQLERGARFVKDPEDPRNTIVDLPCDPHAKVTISRSFDVRPGAGITRLKIGFKVRWLRPPTTAKIDPKRMDFEIMGTTQRNAHGGFLASGRAIKGTQWETVEFTYEGHIRVPKVYLVIKSEASDGVMQFDDAMIAQE